MVSSKKDFGQYTGHYYPPGGHIEPGETKEQALKREIREELGIDVNPVKEMAATKGDVKDQITYWWNCDLSSDEGDIKVDTQEIGGMGFFDKQKMSDMPLWPATQQFFKRFIFKDE